jgi:glutamate N-acetyltransferase / amino-acid N-acetyltransferase
MKWPAGFSSAGSACGIKKDGELDLGILVSDRPAMWAGTFTRNAAAASSVAWSKGRLGSPLRAVVVNSGNANACTGRAGREAVARTAEGAAAVLGCEPAEIAVASTGPIGIPLPVDRLIRGLPAAVATMGADPTQFATSIMTTDTRLKMFEVRSGDATVVGVAKGAAMLAPNMATMLAFLATDARVDAGRFQDALNVAVRRSFDRICVDACESTNDSVFCLSSGATEADPADVGTALQAVCAALARAMVEDAEGASKVVSIRVEGASSEADAAALGKAVAASALWRAAAHGADPNWGRIVAALGSRDRSLDISRLEISIGGIPLFRSGDPVPEGVTDAATAMTSDEFEVWCRVGDGPGIATVLTSDLTPDYVKLNAEGST